MKSLVLSGGTGTRLRPFTYSLPKQLMPVAGRPVLHHCLHNIRDVGITSVGMIVGQRNGPVEQALGDGTALGVRIDYLVQDKPLGLAHCVSVAEDYLDGDDFLMYLGDNMLVGSLADAARDFTRHRPDAKILVTKVDDPQHYGVAELDAAGNVVSLAEKPAHPRSDLAMMGVYFFTPAIHEAVRGLRPSARGELEITDALQRLVTGGRQVSAEIYQGFWKDTGSVPGLLECNRVLLDSIHRDVRGHIDAACELHGPVVVEPGASVIASRLDGPLIVGAGSTVRHSRIGPHTSVGRGCLIDNAHVQESIVLDNVHVEGVWGMRDSVIGRGARVHGTTSGTHRLLLGDQASVQVRTA
ncbi:glucose-1-phosphate thymidylyltransferase [Streptomyces sp. NPDC006193]|uniref:glucose-1-phosphate thymidylyltransferase n=1 Tax=Streptomyces sp. NPDC006193 TaxID=3155717 RepID=UPI0033A4897A